MAMNLSAMTHDAAADFRAKIQSGDARTMTVLLLALVCAVAPFDISHLLLVLVGAGAYALLQPVPVSGSRRAPKGVPRRPSTDPRRIQRSVPPTAEAAAPPAAGVKYLPPAVRTGSGGMGARPDAMRGIVASMAAPKPKAAASPQPSVQPVTAPTFAACAFDAQVEELVASLMPTAASTEAVARLAARVRSAVRTVLPEADVAGFASTSALRSRAFGVAVPDVDIVVRCNQAAFLERFQGRGGPRADRRQLCKLALRAFTDRLVGSGDFKFRRLLFTAEEPKVTLLAGAAADAVPLDMSLNIASPARNAALTAECGRLDARARALILLVRRWARDRGICHAARGHLPPYCWTLLAIYYLQVGAEGEQVLPAFEAFVATASGPAARDAPSDDRSVRDLFRGFIGFYGRFDAKREAVSVRLGRRGAPGARLSMYMMPRENGRANEAAPTIEDPFDQARNLATTMTAEGLKRFREELERAASMFAGESPQLSELLQPWAPAEEAAAAE